MERPLTKNIRAGEAPLDLKGYEQAGGYQGLRAALAMTPAQVQEVVKQANLRGRGGAGFPAGIKWGAVPSGAQARHPIYLVCNADEMEPGTMKDRLLLEGDPHQLIEGMAIAAYAIGADAAYIFLRWGYFAAEERLKKAIAEAYAAHYLGRNILKSSYNLEMKLHVSAGRYMCGEETGLINALEGKRATPRSKPPFPQVSGLWGMPTVVNNVETFCCVPHILQHGADWFRRLGLGVNGGTKIYGVSGRVKRPGLWELPLGTPAREILYDYAGGMQDGYGFRALLPGGASTEFLLDEHLDVKMDFGEVEKVGSRMGTGTMVILDDKTCPVGMLHNLLAFFAQESCGWCTPCREGLPWVTRTLAALEDGRGEPGDLEVLEHHARSIKMGHTFCALAPGAMEPLASGLQYFQGEFARHIGDKRCPYK